MRFQTKNITVLDDCPKELYASFKAVFKDIFGEEWSNEHEARLASKKTIFLQFAYEGSEVHGFKFGYEETPEVFYSWLGGVKLSARNYGIASSLMFAQHDWCKANGYKRVATKSLNKFRAMLIMNIRNGFDVTGTEPDPKRGELKILLEKVL